jgi:NAD(P)-dependent dehydrogenase (short-subunit alcohol dehydrogenase family)
MIDLSGKVAAVTGAAGGIGTALARTLTKTAAKVVLGDVQAERDEQVARQIREAGGQALFVAHDTSIEGQWIAFVDSAPGRFGGIDILINNCSTIEGFRQPQWAAERGGAGSRVDRFANGQQQHRANAGTSPLPPTLARPVLPTLRRQA